MIDSDSQFSIGLQRNTTARVLEGVDISAESAILEIGPLNRPVIRKDFSRIVHYIDHASTDELRHKYKFEDSVDVSSIVDIDIVAPDGRLLQHVPTRYDLIVAAHVVEHVPDLLGWIDEALSALTDGGTLALVVPDKRYTFDVNRRITPFNRAKDAWLENAKRPMLWNVIDHYANVVKVGDPVDLFTKKLKPQDAEPVHTPEELHHAYLRHKAGEYIDCHSWVFTPDHFVEIIDQARMYLGLNFQISKMIPTPPGNLEFYVHLRRV
ncbi:MAG: methyltransferase domain-containing protein [Alsobacter sp.]